VAAKPSLENDQKDVLWLLSILWKKLDKCLVIAKRFLQY
jgi:hypothetical protein